MSYVIRFVSDTTDFNYSVYDANGVFVRQFRSYEAAVEYITHLRSLEFP